MAINYEKKVFGGAACKANLTRVDYKNHQVISRVEHSKKESIAEFLTSDLAKAKITNLSAYRIRLPIAPTVRNAGSKLFTHQWVEFEEENGNVFTLEKINTCILLQSSHRSDTPLDKLRQLRDGVERQQLETMAIIKNDPHPKDKTVKDVILWIFEGGELAEKYNLFDSNCQQFVLNLWQRFSSVPFPNPSKFSDTQPLIEQQAVNMAKE